MELEGRTNAYNSTKYKDNMLLRLEKLVLVSNINLTKALKWSLVCVEH